MCVVLLVGLGLVVRNDCGSRCMVIGASALSLVSLLLVASIKCQVIMISPSLLIGFLPFKGGGWR